MMVVPTSHRIPRWLKSWHSTALERWCSMRTLLPTSLDSLSDTPGLIPFASHGRPAPHPNERVNESVDRLPLALSHVLGSWD